MLPASILILLAAGPTPAPAPSIDAAIHEIAASGRVLNLSEPDSARVNPPPQIAPGAPPLLAFRYLEGDQHYRFSQLNLVVDDAGH